MGLLYIWQSRTVNQTDQTDAILVGPNEQPNDNVVPDDDYDEEDDVVDQHHLVIFRATSDKHMGILLQLQF